MRLLPFIAAIAIASPALAQERPEAPIVHVANEVGTHVLVERVGPEGATSVCLAPCNAQLDPDAQYRLRSDAFRTSSPFKLPSGPRAIDVRIEPRSSGGLVAGIALLATSGLLASAGVFVSAFFAGWNTGLAIALATPLFTGSVATGIPGALLLAKNLESRAVVTPSPHALVVPIVSGAF